MIHKLLYKKQPKIVIEEIESLIKDLVQSDRKPIKCRKTLQTCFGLFKRDVKLYRFELETTYVYIYKKIAVVTHKNDAIQYGEEYFLKDDSAFRLLQKKERTSTVMETVNQIKILRYSINK